MRVYLFFTRLQHARHLKPLSRNPLLLNGLLSVDRHHGLLPNTRFELFQNLVDIVLTRHPNRRATAASETDSRSSVFAFNDVVRNALSKLAFEILNRGGDGGIGRSEAKDIIKQFLIDTNHGPSWSDMQASLGARELTEFEVDTSGLLIRNHQDEIMFCHAAFCEHLAGLELANWPIQLQAEFAGAHADEPRWRGALVTLIRSSKSQANIDYILTTIRNNDKSSVATTDRHLLLLDCLFSGVSFSPEVEQEVARDTIDRIEVGADDGHRFELLDLVLDGVTSNPAGDEIFRRLESWCSLPSSLRDSLFVQLGRWHPTEYLARTLKRALHGDTHQLAAAESLSKVFAGDSEIGNELIHTVKTSRNPWITAATLDSLSRGWPLIDGLDDWLSEAEQSPSSQLRYIGAIGRYRLGHRGTDTRNSLLRTLDEGWSKFSSSYRQEIIDALVTSWADDVELQDACWERLQFRSSSGQLIPPEDIRSILMRLHRNDARVPLWLAEEFTTREHFPLTLVVSWVSLLEPIVRDHENVRLAVDAWLRTKNSQHMDYIEAQLAKAIATEPAKQSMLKRLDETVDFRFWPVWSLLKGWGIEDDEVASALKPLSKIPPTDRQFIAHHIPDITDSVDEAFACLLEICRLTELKRPDFVVEGIGLLGNEIDVERAVSEVLPHVERNPSLFACDATLIQYFHSDYRIREFTIQRMSHHLAPFAAVANVYQDDSEIASMILNRIAPLPTEFRRFIVRRAVRHFDNPILAGVLRGCKTDADEHVMLQANIGLSYAALESQKETANRIEVLRRTLYSRGIGFDHRRVAAFGGLLALGHVGVFANAMEDHIDEPLCINLIDTFSDYAPVLEITAEKWGELDQTLGQSLVNRLSRTTGDLSVFWRSFSSYVARSPKLECRFLEYCDDPSSILDAPILKTLSHVQPGSSLLLDSCKRVLSSEYNRKSFGQLDFVRSVVVASKLVAMHFYEEDSALCALLDACDSVRAYGGALVGLATRWPNHEIVTREHRHLLENQTSPDLIIPAKIWLHCAQGTHDQVTNVFGRFMTRSRASPWDFAEDALAAFLQRVERDRGTQQAFSRLASDADDPSIRASVVRLLHLSDFGNSRSLAEGFLNLESQRSGPHRFGLDVFSNRIRPVEDLIQEVLAPVGDWTR